MGRSPCCSKVGLNRGPWTTKEDALLIKYIQDQGEGQWRSLPKNAGLLRCGKSCRLRWMNYLRPDIKRGNISSDEDDLIIKMHALLGNRWSLIAGRLPGRTDNEIKNYWNTHLTKKLRSRGIDPNTHKKLPQNTFPPTPKSKKRRNSRRSTTTKATSCGNKHKNISKIHAVEAEKVKIHNPKPIRFSSTSPPLSLKIKNGLHHHHHQQITASESLSHGGHGALDTEGKGAPLSNNSAGDGGISTFVHGNPNDHLVHGCNSEFHEPPFNESALDNIYEEYLQLLVTEDNYKPKLDSFVVSISI